MAFYWKPYGHQNNIHSTQKTAVHIVSEQQFLSLLYYEIRVQNKIVHMYKHRSMLLFGSHPNKKHGQGPP
jgi:hypothetical protein